ncbi:trimeric LpxA-like protein, partial [Delitschia confertaspora ATCC 74209]
RTSTTGKRTVSALPKPTSLVIDPSVIIAQHAAVTGNYPITIGPNVVLHPHAKVSSVWAPVVLGDGVVLYERAFVGVVTGGNGSGDERREGAWLGRNVVVETGAIVEAREVGEGTVVEAGGRVGSGVVVGKFCTITASAVVPPDSKIPDFTVVYSGFERRIDGITKMRPDIQSAKRAMHMKHIEVFRRLMPNNIAKW